MHIHWITNTIIPPPISLGGGDRIMVECIRRWSGEHKITVYGNEGAKQLCDWFELKGIEHVTWPADKWKKYGRLTWWLAQTLIGCRRVKDITFSPDEKHLIMVTSEFQPNSMPAFRLKRRYPKTPLVMESFLLAPKWFSGKPGPGWIFTAYRPFQKALLRKVLREAEMILVTGEEDREFIINEGRTPDSVFAVKGGVDLAIPRSVPEPPKKDYDVIFIGRLHPQKGPLELMDIWKMVVAKKPDARLAMIGSGPLEAQCKAKVQRLGLEKHVEFFGFRDGVEKYKIVKASRVVVHPAVYDSGGMAAAEALCCGLPGVSFDLPALRTYYPRGWLKAPPGDFSQFADHIYRLLTEPALYAETSREAYAAGLEWDWNVRAKVIWDGIAKGIGLA
ncbi:MAG: glycosyltransferase family 4 protein [Verrucomicrobiae bacterium]|nr:glycosyltransferase family 4 protein [Verrucomicrobiae bacterium]